MHATRTRHHYSILLLLLLIILLLLLLLLLLQLLLLQLLLLLLPLLLLLLLLLLLCCCCSPRPTCAAPGACAAPCRPLLGLASPLALMRVDLTTIQPHCTVLKGKRAVKDQ